MKKNDKKAKKAKTTTSTLYDCCWYEPSYYDLCCGGVCCCQVVRIKWFQTLESESKSLRSFYNSLSEAILFLMKMPFPIILGTRNKVYFLSPLDQIFFQLFVRFPEMSVFTKFILKLDDRLTYLN